MKIKLEQGAYVPSRAHETDAGMDLMSMDTVWVKAHSGAVVHTGVHVQLPEGTCGLLVSKSGLNTKHDITSTGLIDEGFTGEILVKLYNHGDTDYVIEKGDKVSQLAVLPVRYEKIEIVDEIEGKARGNNGYGSSGKK